MRRQRIFLSKPGGSPVELADAVVHRPTASAIESDNRAFNPRPDAEPAVQPAERRIACGAAARSLASLPLSRLTVQLAFLRLYRQVLHSNFIFQPPVSDFVSSLLEAPRTDNVLASRRTDRSANADNWFLQPPAASCEVSSPLCQLQPSQGRRFCTVRVCRKQFFWKQHERSSGRDYKTINGLRLVAS